MRSRRLKKSRKKDVMALLATLFTLVLIISYVVLYQKSHNPNFCLKCHYEKPYYEHWKSSTHSSVSCYKCHPTIPAKMLFLVIQYNLGLYDMYPRANVPSFTCLQQGCHSKQRLFSERLVIKDKPVFNHKQHLSGPLRGIRLRCSSCHSHIVQGYHVSVVETVCFTCHFMGVGQGHSITGCPSCHGNPTKVIIYHGFRFRHQEYLKLGVSCDQCHVKIIKGTGEVPPQRCHTCHVEKPIPANATKIHKIHVTENGIDCFRCHTKIKHGSIKLVKTFQVTCSNCHTKLHSAQKALYMGVGGKGMGDLPSRMFAAQVTCEGCHIKTKPNPNALQGSFTRYSSPASCVKCHGPGYDKMLDDWNKNLAMVESYVSKRISRLAGSVAKNRATAQLYSLATYNYDFVKAANGVHNVEYAIKLLRISANSLDTIDKKLGYRVPSKPKIIATPDGYCAIMCHNRLGMPQDVYFEHKIIFPHQLHVKKEKIACMKCHSVKHHGETIIKKENCLECHHQMKDAASRCTKCHRLETAFYKGDIKGLVKSEPDPMYKVGIDCISCHDVTQSVRVSLKKIRENCINCHGGEKGYGDILDQYIKEAREIQQEISKKQAQIKRYIDAHKINKALAAKIRVHYVIIRTIKEDLSSMACIHNISYAHELVTIVDKEIKAIKQLLKNIPLKKSLNN